jgi:hypothetical protein
MYFIHLPYVLLVFSDFCSSTVIYTILILMFIKRGKKLCPFPLFKIEVYK